ncbi:flagellar basal-body rod protein FlgG [endosymbiont of Acanthamoeba sp. UWC8]|uniref:flagellar basal-body rod protein FlgG n=1 Tax=endosymbiont of Acanthamoeba sp. UWC8 TaxID=86106 RepID=UPI0004D1EB0D|nr:flagellar basal-body rod protein FlgG [endosymbiont of Acanthamoeba sp. UWC8]AIF81532.1 flagellar basal-body rod protein FlgG [endosymbiont of Acanthamoeba sp. UWC8]
MSLRALNIAATGMVANERKIDNISHNVANSETKGYKRSDVIFNDLLYQTETRMGSLSAADGSIIPTGIQFGLGTAVGATYKVFSQGELIPTPNTPLNLALDGNGFFLVNLPDGNTGYTRAGELMRSPDGVIVNPLGYEISPGITIPQDALNVTITRDGRVQATIAGQPDPQDLGQLDLAIFQNPSGLEAIGDSIYKETTASGAPILGFALDDGFGSIKQHFVESSNVNSITEIMNLIKAQRNYEMNSKVMQTAEQMAKEAIDSKS